MSGPSLTPQFNATSQVLFFELFHLLGHSVLPSATGPLHMLLHHPETLFLPILVFFFKALFHWISAWSHFFRKPFLTSSLFSSLYTHSEHYVVFLGILAIRVWFLDMHDLMLLRYIYICLLIYVYIYILKS